MGFHRGIGRSGESRVETLLKDYLKTYESRQRKSPTGVAFNSPEQTALCAVVLVQAAAAGVLIGDPRLALERVESLTREPLENLRRHSVATDMAGYVRACSFGNLPLEAPPLREIEWALESGRGSAVVRGIFGVAWRALFLTAAWPYIPFGHRPEATKELRRWVTYLRDRALQSSRGDAGLRPYEQARFAMFLGHLGVRLADEELTDSASSVFGLAAACLEEGPESEREAGGLATAHIAQLLLAAKTVGEDDRRRRALDMLLARGVEGERLLRSSGQGTEAFELSPWIPLALLASRSSQLACDLPLLPHLPK